MRSDKVKPPAAAALSLVHSDVSANEVRTLRSRGPLVFDAPTHHVDDGLGYGFVDRLEAVHALLHDDVVHLEPFLHDRHLVALAAVEAFHLGRILHRHGSIPPRRDVAERLAAVLELDPEPLLMWADSRMSPAYRQQVESRFNDAPLLLQAPARALSGVRRDSATLSPDAQVRDGSDLPNQIPILPAGADPNRYRRKPIGYLDRIAIERLIGGRAELIRPIAYELSDEDFDRLRRVSNPQGRPLHEEGVCRRPGCIRRSLQLDRDNAGAEAGPAVDGVCVGLREYTE